MKRRREDGEPARGRGAAGGGSEAAQAAAEEEEVLARVAEGLRAGRAALPIAECSDALVDAVSTNASVVVVGETGSGKTTQLPQFLLDAGGLLARERGVAVTQPRRVAATSLARRVAAERAERLGAGVGYAVRFDECACAATRLKFLTDGLLLREALADPLLARYGVVVVDEAHERTVQTDVLLGLLKGVQQKRAELPADDGPGPLRLVVMSATLDAEAFSSFLGGAPVLYVRGRQFAVGTFYTPEPEEDYLDAALVATMQVHDVEPPGDVLVFLTGQEEIEAMAQLLREHAGRLPDDAAPMVVAPLYAALPPEQQQSVFEPAPPGARKVVLATNIAETSLTIPGIRYVVDPGLCKARAFNPRSGVDTLAVQPVSQAQARQRAGRAGREAPGKCFRLYTEATFGDLAPATVPEIRRANLGAVVLQLKALGVNNPLDFAFIDPPPREAILKSLELLYALGALSPDGALTALGKRMSRFPLEPMAARALVAAADEGCTEEVLVIVSVLSAEGTIFYAPKEKREKAAAAFKLFRAREGDHLTSLAVFRAHAAEAPKRRAQWCRERFVSARALQRASDVYAQLRRACEGEGLELESCGGDTERPRRALVAGFFLHAARLQPDGSGYRTIAGAQPVSVHPSSALFHAKPAPEYIVYNELVHTSKLYVRDVSAVEPAWLTELAPRFYKPNAARARAAAHPLAAAGARR